MSENEEPQQRSSARRRHWSALRRRWDILLVISLGGALGSLARWGVAELLPWSGTGFPAATFVANITGGLALGVLMVFVLDVWPPQRYVRPFVGVGLLGGYTTFSTYMLETRTLVADDQVPMAMTYLAGTLVAGLTAVWIGIAIARLAVRQAQGRRRAKAGAGSGAGSGQEPEVPEPNNQSRSRS